MRIATSTVYDQQTLAIDNLSAQYQTVGQQLSTGKSLTAPGDNPQVIAQDLQLSGTLGAENGAVADATAASNELTLTDSTLAALSNVLTTARTVAVGAGTDVIPNGTQRKYDAKQIDGLLNQVISLSNTKYGNTWIFGGSGQRATPPVVSTGSPANGVAFSGNLDQRTTTVNGQTFKVGTTLQQAFNYQAPDGTPDVFQLLANLRNTLDNEPVVDQSAGPINAAASVIYGPPAAAGAPAATVLGQLASLNPGTNLPTGVAPLSGQKLTPDNGVPGQYSIAIDGTNAAGQPATQVFTFTNATAIDDGTAASVVGQINAATGTIGVKAAWNVAQQRLVLTSTTGNSQNPFTVSDVASPGGATTASNFTTVFQLTGQANIVTNLSSQIGDIDRVLNNVLQTRADVGQRMQVLSATQTQLSGQITDNTNAQSGLEDTNIAAATAKFSQLQTALQASYLTTQRLESKHLLDFIQ